MCIFPKRNRVARFQDIEFRRKTTGGKIRCDEKPTKSQKHFRTKVILWVNQSVYEIRPKLVISKLRPLLQKKSVYQWNDEHTKAFEELKQQIVNITENNHF